MPVSPISPLLLLVILATSLASALRISLFFFLLTFCLIAEKMTRKKNREEKKKNFSWLLGFQFCCDFGISGKLIGTGHLIFPTIWISCLLVFKKPKVQKFNLVSSFATTLVFLVTKQ